MPENEIPTNNQVVWVMFYPHKFRGSMEESVESIEIACGTCEHYDEDIIVVNSDEIGEGTQEWALIKSARRNRYNRHILAWLPLEELALPQYNGIISK